MNEEKKNVCRVCLSATKKKYVSLFKKHKESYLFDQINSLTNVQIRENDGLPDKICSSCVTELDTAISFRQKCEGSNLILQSDWNTPLVDYDVKAIIVKKEEPPDLEPIPEYIDSEVFNDNNSFGDDDLVEEKPDINKSSDLRKSRAVDQRLQCDDCGSYFKSKCKLRVHWKRVHLTEKLLCLQCKRRFKSVSAFKKHQENKKQNCLAAKNFRIEGEGKGRMFYCKECDYKSVRIKDLMTHWVTHTGDRPFKCDLCPKTCTQLSSLTAHKEAAHKEYKMEIPCQYCGKLLKGRNKIYRHVKTHTDRGVQCQVCQKVLKNRNILAQHMQRHSGQKSYTCEQCAHSFYTFSELSNHRRQVHNKHKTWYKCNHCDYKAVRKESIKKHESKHADGVEPCTVCGMFFESIEKLILHQRRHFEEKKYPCPYCEMKFFRRDTVPKHIKSKHREIYQLNKNIRGFSNEESLDKKFNNEDNVNVYVFSTVSHKSDSPIAINDEDA